jgi:peptidoglycan-associated lipoprotein
MKQVIASRGRSWVGCVSLVGVVALASLAGCSSTPLPEQSAAGVEERDARPVERAVAVQEAPRVVGIVPPATQTGLPPHRDPNHPLNKQRSVFFDYDNDSVKDEYRAMLQIHAKYLTDNPARKILVQGNCDERGSREHNLALGQRRSDNIKRALQLMGVRETQIESVSLGEEKPRCSESNEQCYAQNRRGDILYDGEF